MHSNTIIVDMPSEAISLTDDGKSVGSALKKKKKKPLLVVKKLVIFEDPGNGFHENDRRQYKKEVILTRMIHITFQGQVSELITLSRHFITHS